MAAKKSKEPDDNVRKEELSFERDLNKYAYISSIMSKIINKGCTVAIVFIIMYYTNEMTKHLSGQSTNVLINFIADLSINEYVAYMISGLALGYGKIQERLKKRHIEKSTIRISELEQMVNPGRLSSNLTNKGETPKGD